MTILKLQKEKSTSMNNNTIFFAICTVLFSFMLAMQAHSQSLNNSQRYLPEYNLWLPGSSNNHSNAMLQPYEKRYHTDSLYYWDYVNTNICCITDIFFIDSLYGWATYNAGGVIRTSNSGFNWDSTKLVSGQAYVNGIHFIDRNTGWAVGNVGLIRKTTNGGLNWINQDFGDYHNTFNCVHFFNKDTGVVAGSYFIPYTCAKAYIIKTTNGGMNWNGVYMSNCDTSFPTEIRRQFWINNDTAWMCGIDILLKTTDGGLTYKNYYPYVSPTQNGRNVFFDLYFINKETGWICGSNLDHKNLYKTTNAGMNWIFQDNPVAYYEFPQINGIIFINDDFGFASSYVGLILFTTNAGTNWIIDQIVNDETWSFSKYDNSKVWCTGGYGNIWYSILNPPIGIEPISSKTPRYIDLEQNYPNPFNPKTTIVFQIPFSAEIKIVLYDACGREILVLADERKIAGKYKIELDGSNYASGIYFYRLTVKAPQTKSGFVYSETRKLVLLK